MAVSSGAGASVASGAGYQARVAAYFVGCRLTKLPIPAMPHGEPSKISLETNEAVDDIQVAFAGGKRAVVQAKRTISFSTLAGSELESVLEQFVSQARNSEQDADEAYYLITTSGASKRITGDMAAALDAARGVAFKVFRRDQPKAIVSTYEDLLAAIARVQQKLGAVPDTESARAVLAKSHVVVLDVDPNSSLEQAIVLALHANGYAAPAEMWGKLVADCLEWARRRRTVELADIEASHARLKTPIVAPLGEAEHRYLKVKLTTDRFEVGRELVVARARANHSFLKTGSIGIIEFYRFDGDCRPRLRFEDDRLILGNGDELELWGRFATWTGLNRFIDENIDRFEGDVVAIPMNVEEDLESGPCAKTHRKALEAVAAGREATKCVHCELPVSASMSPVVEFGDGKHLCFGISHRECVRPTDRIMGRADSEMFGKYPELVNFDVNAWFNAAHLGHGVFVGINGSKQAIAPIVWGGTPPLEDTVGKFVVASVLEDGTEQLASNRGSVQRFTKQHADEFALSLRNSVLKAKADGDPLSYSDQSRAFAARSVLVRQLGGTEKIQSIVDVRARVYDAKEAASIQAPEIGMPPY